MVKIIGCLLMLAGCYMLGQFKASSYAARCKELENIIETAKLLEMNISYTKDPLAKAFIKATANKTSWYADVLKLCSENMSNRLSLNESWEKAVENSSKHCPLTKDDISILDNLIQGLGKSDSESQMKILEPTMIRLQINLNKAYTDNQKQGKMYKAIGTSAGIILVILLI